MKIEIDLANLGFHYDEDGDPIGNRTLEDAVVQAAAERMIANSVNDLKRRIGEKVDEIVTTRISVVVDEVLSRPIQQTTPWGETTKPPTTVKEIVRTSLEGFLNNPARSDRYGSSSNSPANLRELVNQQTTNILTRELGEEIKKAKGEVHNLIREKAIKAAADAIAKG